MNFYDYMALWISKQLNGELSKIAVIVDFDNPVCAMKIVVPPVEYGGKITVDLWGRLFLYKNFTEDEIAQNQDVVQEVFDDSGFEETFFDISNGDTIDLFSITSQQELNIKDIKQGIDNLRDKDITEYFKTSANAQDFISRVKEDISVFQKLSKDAVNRIKEGIDG